MMLFYPICGDPNHYTDVTFCTMSPCSGSYNARRRRVVDDSGEVCMDKVVACNCPPVRPNAAAN